MYSSVTNLAPDGENKFTINKYNRINNYKGIAV